MTPSEILVTRLEGARLFTVQRTKRVEMQCGRDGACMVSTE